MAFHSPLLSYLYGVRISRKVQEVLPCLVDF
jgi:hypothetical protein